MISVEDKLQDFPPVYYMSFFDSYDRREILNEQFKKYGITNVTPIISTKESDESNIVSGPLLFNLNSKEIACVCSHLKAIKYWYQTSNSDYAMFMEDDVTLETIDYWNFTWNEFMSTLPKDWECVQLLCIRKDLPQIKMQKRAWDDWAITAYIINRDYAKRLLDDYYPQQEFLLDIRDTLYWPLPENIIYFIGRTYTLPIFAENPTIKTTFTNKNKVAEHDDLHVKSSIHVIDWWKYNGEKINIKDLTKPEYYENDLEFNS